MVFRERYRRSATEARSAAQHGKAPERLDSVPELGEQLFKKKPAGFFPSVDTKTIFWDNGASEVRFTRSNVSTANLVTC